MVIVPSTAVESMGLGALGGLTALGREFAPEVQTKPNGEQAPQHEGGSA
jgi:hypothetical protein